jgi:hypothetical protein
MKTMSATTLTSTRVLIVGISVSEPDKQELVRLGLDQIHVRHAYIEIARHILARGWSIAYGGDLRKEGYTEALFDLIRTYNRKDLSGPERVHHYLSWPAWLDLTVDQRADLSNVATITDGPRPDGAPESLPEIAEREPGDLLWSSLATSQMRAEMDADIGARVVLGGRVSGQQGLYPGIAEEAALALRSKTPLYVAGGFGGCARLVASMLKGANPAELSLDYQLKHTPRYAELVGAAAAAGQEPTFDELRGAFTAAGIEGLHNGLSEAENMRLMQTDDVDEIVALVVQGLRRIDKG